jgi:hypothetical protein
MRPSGRFIVSTSALRRRLCDRHRRCDAADREICASRNEKGGPQAAFFKMFDARFETANSTCVRTIRPSCRRRRRRRPLSRRLRRPKPSPLHRDTGAMLIVTGATVTIAPRIGSRSRSTGRISTTTESTGAGYPGHSASDPTPDLDFLSGVIAMTECSSLPDGPKDQTRNLSQLISGFRVRSFHSRPGMMEVKLSRRDRRRHGEKCAGDVPEQLPVGGERD